MNCFFLPLKYNKNLKNSLSIYWCHFGFCSVWNSKTLLGGGLKYFYFYPYLGRWSKLTRRNPSDQLLFATMVSAVTHVGFDTVDGRHPAEFISLFFHTVWRYTLTWAVTRVLFWVSGVKHCLHDRICEFHCGISVYGNHCVFRGKIENGPWIHAAESTNTLVICCFFWGDCTTELYRDPYVNPSVEWNVTYGFVLSVAQVVQAISSINS